MNRTAVAPSPRNLWERAAWLVDADAKRAGDALGPRHSGYVDVDDAHFHVAHTLEGAIVSRVRWAHESARSVSDAESKVQPAAIHDLFSVTEAERNQALLAWGKKLDDEADRAVALRTRALVGVVSGRVR